MMTQHKTQKMDKQAHQRIEQLRFVVIAFAVFTSLQLIVFSVLHWKSQSEISILQTQVGAAPMSGGDSDPVSFSNRIKRSWMQDLANSNSATCSCERAEKGDSGIPGPPGRNGAPGAQGAPGAEGPRGEKGESGSSVGGQKGSAPDLDTECRCRPGEPGMRGLPGLPGEKGDDGVVGPAGRDAPSSILAGPVGIPNDLVSRCDCPPGLPGQKGAPGLSGSPGFNGLPGQKGEPGTCGCS